MSERPAELGRWMAGAIQVGTGASVALLLAGVALGMPVIAWYGLLLLTVTPAVQLGVAAVAFARRQEVRYSLIASVVLALLLAGLAAAALAGQGIRG
jgi:4-hydroxybenzoate polyprenyltransferase